MGNINTIVNNDMCCGCGICAGVCSENCISMDINLNGFYRPTMNRENCSNCGKCLNICPSGEAIVHEEEGSMFGEVISVYAGWAKDENIRYNSASGGIATAISLELLDKGFAVGGTSFDETNTLRTISIVTTIQGLIVVLGGILLAPFTGIVGVMIASIISNLYRDIDLLFFIPRKVTKLKITHSLWRILRMIGSLVIIFLISQQCLEITPNNYFEWFIDSLVVGIISLVTVIIINLICERNAMQQVYWRLVRMVKK